MPDTAFTERSFRARRRAQAKNGERRRVQRATDRRLGQSMATWIYTPFRIAIVVALNHVALVFSQRPKRFLRMAKHKSIQNTSAARDTKNIVHSNVSLCPRLAACRRVIVPDVFSARSLRTLS